LVAQHNLKDMLPERLVKLETTLRNNTSIPEATRRELLDLVDMFPLWAFPPALPFNAPA
jgi:hypothetical protein